VGRPVNVSVFKDSVNKGTVPLERFSLIPNIGLEDGHPWTGCISNVGARRFNKRVYFYRTVRHSPYPTTPLQGSKDCKGKQKDISKDDG
jgi:hypothetical protein